MDAPITVVSRSTDDRWRVVFWSRRLGLPPPRQDLSTPFSSASKHDADSRVAVVATARKIAVLVWHLLTKGEDYAFGRPALHQAKLRQMEIKAGMLSKRGGNTPGRARDYNIKSLRDVERAVRRAGGGSLRSICRGVERAVRKQSSRCSKRPGCADAANEERQ